MSNDMIKIDYNGSIVYVKKNKDGLIICPICEEVLLSDVSDLYNHILAHARRYVDKRVKVKSREE
ncbi:MAG: hypothetical protein QXO93_04930 [Acidilobaceae archaeon]